MEDYNWLKLFFIIVAFFEAFLMGLLPVKVKRCRNSITALGIANAFAGGVFIAIALMHILPEQVESWEGVSCENWLESQDLEETIENKAECPDAYPLPFLLTVVGYSMILVLDKVLFDAHALLHIDGHDHDDVLRKSLTKASHVVRDQME